MRSSRKRLRRALLASLALIAFVAACAVLKSGTKRQEWDEERWGPLVPHKTFPADCGLCHVPERWDVLRKDFSFDHAKETGVALEGAHEDAACLRCHNDFGPVQEYVARGCQGCHTDIHRSQLGSDCLECHNVSHWRPKGAIAEHARTRFPLTGAHLAVSCEKCHQLAPTGTYSGAPTQCQICHADDVGRSAAFDHVANGWTARCERCHFPTGWTGANFTHAFFPITGGHSGLTCDQCHPGNDFSPIPSDCFSCHSDDFAGAPNHVAGNYSHDCLRCHSLATWQGARFDHSFFPLTLGHSGLACVDCHTSGTTGPIPSACISCHQDDFNGAPNHVAGNYPQDCTRCHSMSTWDGATFQHATFELRGPHDVACNQCHTGGDTSTFNCLACHSSGETNNDHDEVNGYSYNSAACYQCHPSGRD